MTVRLSLYDAQQLHSAVQIYLQSNYGKSVI